MSDISLDLPRSTRTRKRRTPQQRTPWYPGKDFRELMPFMWLPVYNLSPMCAGREYINREMTFNHSGYSLTVRPIDPDLATATIYDADVLMLAISAMNAAREEGSVSISAIK